MMASTTSSTFFSARFIANKASYQFKHRQMDTMLEKLRDTLHKQEEEK